MDVAEPHCGSPSYGAQTGTPTSLSIRRPHRVELRAQAGAEQRDERPAGDERGGRRVELDLQPVRGGEERDVDREASVGEPRRARRQRRIDDRPAARSAAPRSTSSSSWTIIRPAVVSMRGHRRLRSGRRRAADGTSSPAASGAPPPRRSATVGSDSSASRRPARRRPGSAAARRRCIAGRRCSHIRSRTTCMFSVHENIATTASCSGRTTMYWPKAPSPR